MAQKRIMQQQQTASTHFVRVVSDTIQSKSDTSDNEQEYMAYPAERTLRDQSGKRREVFNGVYPPPAREYRETLKKEQCQRQNERTNKENIPFSARRTAHIPIPQVLQPATIWVDENKRIVDTNKSTSKIEELVEPEIVSEHQQEKKRETHHQERTLEEPERIRPGPGAPQVRIFNPENVKKVEVRTVEKDLPKVNNKIQHYAPAPLKDVETEKECYKVVAIQRPHYNKDDDDEIMEDTPVVRGDKKKERDRGQLQHQSNIKALGEKPNVPILTPWEDLKHMPRISELLAKIDPRMGNLSCI
ncbi:hypothetical protein EV702DRAFT_1047266 [Suillus placidus]|uniref:Uncharacterized protein n=1 Tax=Suillus placidus TaxID=48579 RepID=A0A9P6ZQI9_9AGAM|nr:hypothetical protein EV702DRAFT_1047266 [Suillus placidus]